MKKTFEEQVNAARKPLQEIVEILNESAENAIALVAAEYAAEYLAKLKASPGYLELLEKEKEQDQLRETLGKKKNATVRLRGSATEVDNEDEH